MNTPPTAESDRARGRTRSCEATYSSQRQRDDKGGRRKNPARAVNDRWIGGRARRAHRRHRKNIARADELGRGRLTVINDVSDRGAGNPHPVVKGRASTAPPGARWSFTADDSATPEQRLQSASKASSSRRTPVRHIFPTMSDRVAVERLPSRPALSHRHAAGVASAARRRVPRQGRVIETGRGHWTMSTGWGINHQPEPTTPTATATIWKSLRNPSPRRERVCGAMRRWERYATVA